MFLVGLTHRKRTWPREELAPTDGHGGVRVSIGMDGMAYEDSMSFISSSPVRLEGIILQVHSEPSGLYPVAEPSSPASPYLTDSGRRPSQSQIMRLLHLPLPSLLCVSLTKAYLVAPPGTPAPGATQRCSGWVQSSYALSCDIIVRVIGMTLPQFQEWVSTAKEATQILFDLFATRLT